MQSELDKAWSGHPVWTILDTDFGPGKRFLEVCARWHSNKQRPALLHYVALCEPQSKLPGRALRPGFNRFLYEDGQISLTLCLGDSHRMMSELRMQADSVYGTVCNDWDAATLSLLAGNCRPGAQLNDLNISGANDAHWARIGFKVAAAAADPEGKAHHRQIAVYAPPWPVKNTRFLTNAALKVGRCAVIGAGLGGASVARALALRGWDVSVLDAMAQPACGASGLPVGLCVPQHSADHNPQSRLLEQGVRLSLGHALRWLNNGQDCRVSGVLEKAAKHTWHADAGWIKPASLVRAWLSHDRICFTGNAAVKSLSREASQWVLKDALGQVLERADLVVFATANGSTELIQSLTPQDVLREDVLRKIGALQAMHGLVSIATMPADLPSATPVNGRGSVIPGVPNVPGQGSGTAAHLYAGASYFKDTITPADHAGLHAQNLEKLQFLAPEYAPTLADAIARDSVQSWSGTRCVTHDRLPLVGPIEAADKPSLWICTGMGSRGISLAALCAELLVAYIGAEPLPLEASLAKSLSVNRPRKRSRRAHSDSALPIASPPPGGVP